MKVLLKKAASCLVAMAMILCLTPFTAKVEAATAAEIVGDIVVSGNVQYGYSLKITVNYVNSANNQGSYLEFYDESDTLLGEFSAANSNYGNTTITISRSTEGELAGTAITGADILKGGTLKVKYTVPAYSGADYVSAVKTVTVPEIPVSEKTPVNASSSKTSYSVSMSWTNDYTKIDGYNLEQKILVNRLEVSGAKSGTPSNDEVAKATLYDTLKATETSFYDSDVKTGYSYIYVLVYQDVEGKQSKYLVHSNWISITDDSSSSGGNGSGSSSGSDSGNSSSGNSSSGSGSGSSSSGTTYDYSTPIYAPSGVTVTKISAKKVSITWSSVYSAAKYKVYRGKKCVKTTKATRVKLSGKKYVKGKYKVVAIDSKGKKAASKWAKPKANAKVWSVDLNPKTRKAIRCDYTIKKVSLKGKTYTVTGYAVNTSTISTATKYRKLVVKITANGKVVAKKTIKNKKLNIKPYAKKKITIKIKGKAGVDLQADSVSWTSADSIVEPLYLN